MGASGGVRRLTIVSAIFILQDRPPINVQENSTAKSGRTAWSGANSPHFLDSSHKLRGYFESIAILSPPFTVTRATTFSPLSVNTSLPSAKCIMFRTTPPPEGIVQV